MIPTWKNIGGLSLDLSQRATQAAGNEAQQALAGLQDMAAQQRQFNVKAEDAATQENLLKFQQAARNMSLGELDALNKSAPEQLMSRFGLTNRNISQALDFSNRQDDALMAEQKQRYDLQEAERQRMENPIRAKLMTAVAQAEASGNFQEANRLIAENEQKLMDASGIYGAVNNAKQAIQQREIAKEERE